MRKKRFFTLLKIISCSFAAVFFLVSLFATQIGLDNDPGWGKGRIILLIGACLFSLFFLLLQFQILNQKIQLAWKSINKSILNSRIIAFFRKIEQILQKNTVKVPWMNSKKVQRFFFGVMGVVLVVLTLQAVIHSEYVHIQSSNYYNQLADGFLNGKTSLPEKPPQALSELENPYNWLNREGIVYLWDATFYNGEYYLYWGMVPALIAAALKALHPMIILDQHLVWGFYIGISLLMALLFSNIHKLFFPSQPTWFILIFTWMSGTAMPMLWLTTRPSVYEAAIAGGQFFLVLGLFAAFQALWTDTKPNGWYFLAGFAWGAAVNCRFSLVITICWLAAYVAFRVYRKQNKQQGNWLLSLIYFSIPLLLWAGALFGYNYLRFGNILEMGHRYQLNGPGMPAEYDQVMSLQYVIPSMYSYLVRPLQFHIGSFPYVSAPFISESMWPFFIHLPKYYYYPEPTSGILLSTPFVWFAFFPLLQLWRRFSFWLSETGQPDPEIDQQNFIQFTAGIGIAILVTFGFLLVFNAASMRYLADITPMLMLYSAAGFWWILQRTEKAPILRSLLSLMMILLVTYGGVVSIYASFSPHY